MSRVMQGVVMVCLAIGLTVAAGCKTGQAGVRNRMGTYDATVAASPQRTTEAARQALEDMQFRVVSSNSSQYDGHVVGYTARDHKIDISVSSEGPDVSTMSVRVGRMGDQQLSQEIIRRVRRQVGGGGGAGTQPGATR